jgi:hypothetical protein
LAGALVFLACSLLSATSVSIGPGLASDEVALCQAAVSLAKARSGQVFPWLHSGAMPSVRFFKNGVPGTQASPWVGGLYHPQDHRIDIQHVPLLLQQGRLDSTLQHEFVHAALALAGTARLPLWLEEGAAIYLSGQSLDEVSTSVAPARSLAHLEHGFRLTAKSRQQSDWLRLKTYNRQARTLVAALAARNGLEHLIGFLRTLKNGTHFSQALISWYTLAPEDLATWL